MWQLDLPKDLRSFDYATISDVIVHVRYTARQGGGQLGDQAVTELKDALSAAATAGLALLFSRTIPVPATMPDDLNADTDPVPLTIAPDATVLKRAAPDAYLVVRYGIADA
ncbi:MAG TPA: hypothetical protein VFV73_35185 [Streptosporangiaceae bacterium]|nr:hypothetical protein [Streptosporangiaceae bacterium]